MPLNYLQFLSPRLLCTMDRFNSRVSSLGWDSGTVRCLKAYILKTIAQNQKILLNLLTNFLRSFQIHEGPTSDI